MTQDQLPDVTPVWVDQHLERPNVPREAVEAPRKPIVEEFAQKRKALVERARTNATHVIDVVRATRNPLTDETMVEGEPEDIDALLEEIDLAIKKAPVAFTKDEVMSFVLRVDTALVASKKRIEQIDTEKDPLDEEYGALERTLGEKRAALAATKGKPLDFVKGLRIRREIEAIGEQMGTVRRGYSSEEHEERLARKAYERDGRLDDIEKLLPEARVKIVEGFVKSSFDAIAQDIDPLVKEMGESTELQEVIFEDAIDKLARPKMGLLIEQGHMSEEDAELYLALLREDFEDQRNGAIAGREQEAVERKRLLLRMAVGKPGLERIYDVMKGIQRKDYGDIFECLLRDEVRNVVFPIRDEIATLGMGYLDNDINESLKAINGEFFFTHSTYNELQEHKLTGKTRRAWRAARGSEAASIFSTERWKSLERQLTEKILERHYSSHLWIRGSLERDDRNYDQLWSIVEHNDTMRRKVLPHVLISLGSQMTGFHEREFGVRMYELANSLSEEDMAVLQEDGYPNVSSIKTTVLENPTDFDQYHLYNPTLPKDDRNAYTDNPPHEEIKRAIVDIAFVHLEKNISGIETKNTIARDLARDYLRTQNRFIEEKLWASAEPFSEKEAVWLMQSLRSLDKVLPYDRRIAPLETWPRFHEAINMYRTAVLDPSVPEEARIFLQGEPILQAVARQPEKAGVIFDLTLHSEDFTKLRFLMQKDGPLAVGAGATLEVVFSAGNPAETAKEIVEEFEKKRPYFESLYAASRRLHGEKLRASNSGYPVGEIPLLDGTRVTIAQFAQDHKRRKAENPDAATPLEEIIGDEKIRQKVLKGEEVFVPFRALNGMAKERVFKEKLQMAIETTRDEAAKQEADERNRRNAHDVLDFPGEVFIHGTAVDTLDPIFLNGVLPREVLGLSDDAQGFPFHGNFFSVEKNGTNIPAFIMNHERASHYGSSERHGGRFGNEGQLFLVFDRGKTAYESEVNYAPEGGWENHKVILGGMPGTEVSAIILRNPKVAKNLAAAAVVENGFYIPMYDMESNLVFTKEEYDALREDLNLSVKVPVWEFSFKTGEAKGSHKPAGEYVVPQEDGAKKYYVKFAAYDLPPGETDVMLREQEEKNRIWNEYLADKIYRHLGILTPDTEIVKVNRVYGHAQEEVTVLPKSARPDAKAYGRVARFVDLDEAPDVDLIRQDLKHGFIFDALLANWDIALEKNVAASGGRAIRVDNGGALLFRAQGERKKSEDFSGVVSELRTMAGSYPELTKEDIEAQLRILKEKFTDRDIGELVDSVRLSRKDRDFLKTRLRERRDYLFSYYNSETQRVG